MGKASSAKKVARAARAGSGGKSSKRQRNLLFPVSIGLIVIFGVALVAFAVQERADEKEEALGDHPTIQDHWHAAYGVRICADADGEREGGFQPPFVSENDPAGIHTHSDGVIHIHPFGSGSAGDNATLGVFFDAMGVTINDDTIDLGNDVKVTEGDATCGANNRDAIVQVARWENARETEGVEPEIITEGIEDINFQNDSEAYTVAFAPEGADIPPPPTIPQLDQLTDIGPQDQQQQNTPTTPFDPATATSLPPATAGNEGEPSATTVSPTTAAP
jgi:hypothetical protein